MAFQQGEATKSRNTDPRMAVKCLDEKKNQKIRSKTASIGSDRLSSKSTLGDNKRPNGGIYSTPKFKQFS